MAKTIESTPQQLVMQSGATKLTLDKMSHSKHWLCSCL